MKFFKEPGAEISGPGVVPKFKKISILVFSEQGYTPSLRLQYTLTNHLPAKIATL